MGQKIIRVLFHHGDFERGINAHSYFGKNGAIHQQLQKITAKNICWALKGGFIYQNRETFWHLIAKAEVLFLRAQNMDHEDMSMHWNHAEDNMLNVLKKIREINPTCKIFFYEYTPNDPTEFEKFGTFITDLHGDEELLNYFKNL